MEKSCGYCNFICLFLAIYLLILKYVVLFDSFMKYVHFLYADMLVLLELMPHWMRLRTSSQSTCGDQSIHF